MEIKGSVTMVINGLRTFCTRKGTENMNLCFEHKQRKYLKRNKALLLLACQLRKRVWQRELNGSLL